MGRRSLADAARGLGLALATLAVAGALADEPDPTAAPDEPDAPAIPGGAAPGDEVEGIESLPETPVAEAAEGADGEDAPEAIAAPEPEPGAGADGAPADEPPDEPEVGPGREEAAAQDQAEAEEADLESPKRRAALAPDDIRSNLFEAAQRSKSFFEVRPVEELHRRWQAFNDELDEASALRLGFAHTMAFQWATPGPGRRSSGAGDIDIFGRWHPLRDVEGWDGLLGFATEYRYQVGSLTPGELGDEIGSLWRTSRGFTELSPTLTEVWWRQRFLDDGLVVTFGRLNAKNLTGTNRLSSANLFFMNAAFSDNPARTYPANGWGVDVRVQPSRDWYVTLNAQEASGSTDSIEFELEGRYAVAAEVGWTPEFEGIGRGNYRFTVWNVDEVEGRSEESGFGLSFDQKVGERLTPFLRYAVNDGGGARTKRILAAGVGVASPPWRPDDMWGVGVAWGQPSDSSLRDQWTTEVFYRFQLTPTQQLTLGVQAIVDPSEAPEDDLIGVLELRWRVAF